MVFLHTGLLLAAAPCLTSPDRRPTQFSATACPPRQPAFGVAEPKGALLDKQLNDKRTIFPNIIFYTILKNENPLIMPPN
jgi:hypothetical protein